MTIRTGYTRTSFRGGHDDEGYGDNRRGERPNACFPDTTRADSVRVGWPARYPSILGLSRSDGGGFRTRPRRHRPGSDARAHAARRSPRGPEIPAHDPAAV